MKLLFRVDRAIAVLETALIVLLLGVMVLLDFTQVILRNFFSFGFTWADTLLRQMVLWIAFLGASLAVQERKHISIDVLTRFLPSRATKYSRFATDLFTAVVCLIFLKASVKFVENEIAQGTILLLDIPTWYFQFIIPVGFALMCFRVLLKMLKDVMGPRADRENPQEKT